jgi:hypothetical protein
MRLLSNIAIVPPVVLLMTATACIHRVPAETPIAQSWTSPQIERFVAQPQVIHRGETVLLTWNARNVSRVTLEEYLEPDGTPWDQLVRTLGEFPANGTTSVWPKATATYVLTCGGQGESGLACVSASVNVIVK